MEVVFEDVAFVVEFLEDNLLIDLLEGDGGGLGEGDGLFDVEGNGSAEAEGILPLFEVVGGDSSVFAAFVAFDSFFLDEFDDSSLVLEDACVDGGSADGGV